MTTGCAFSRTSSASAASAATSAPRWSSAPKLLSGLMLDHRKDADDLFAPLRPHMGEFIRSLKERGRDAG